LPQDLADGLHSRQTFVTIERLIIENDYFGNVGFTHSLAHSLTHSFIHFWRAPIGVRSTKRGHQSPEWTIQNISRNEVHKGIK